MSRTRLAGFSDWRIIYDPGTLVEVVDGSYSFDVRTGEHTPGISLMGRIWKVVDHSLQRGIQPCVETEVPNDVMILDEKTGQVVSIRSKYLKPLTPDHGEDSR